MKTIQQRGETIVSLSIALLIAALLTFYLVKDQSIKMTELDYDSVGFSAAVVGEGLRSYYAQNCSQGYAMSTPNVTTLINLNYILSPSSVENRMGLLFTTSIDNPGTKDALLVVSTQAPTSGIAFQISDENTGSDTNGRIVNFKFKPLIASEPEDMRFQQMQEYFGESTCN
jgi:hypothetical protein